MAKHRSGHWCWCCARQRPNERFSGAGHRRHLCKDCSKLGQDELAFRQFARNVDRLVDEALGPGKRKRARAREQLERLASTAPSVRMREYVEQTLAAWHSWTSAAEPEQEFDEHQLALSLDLLCDPEVDFP